MATVLAGVGTATALGGPPHGQGLSLDLLGTPPTPSITKSQQKADWHVVQIVQSLNAQGTAVALQRAHALDMSVTQGSVRLVIEAANVARAKEAVAAAGGETEAIAANLVQVLLPPAGIQQVIDDPSVSYVRPPLSHNAVSPVVDEGVATTSAASWHSGGQNGAGIKVAIIDLGFAGYTSAQATGDLPASLTTVDDCSGGFTTATDHGTAVAEIVYKMAPAAQLYLICVGTEVQLAQAETYAKANGVKVINHSVAWFNSSRGDGTGAAGTPDATVADALANGILWVNSAGNSAQSHWSGSFVDNGSGWNLFTPSAAGDGFYLPASATECVALKWDAWPTTAQDYDLYLAQTDGTTVAYSIDPQTGTQPPTEQLCYTNTTGTSQPFYTYIYRYSATQTALRFDLYPGETSAAICSTRSRLAASLNPRHRHTCWLREPCAGPGRRSSRTAHKAPTIDGRIKPDISGPDAASSTVYGASTGCDGSGFTGTSRPRRMWLERPRWCWVPTQASPRTNWLHTSRTTQPILA